MHDAPVDPAHRRDTLLDGLRGVAILLVVLSHGWTIWPFERLDDQRWSWALFGSGNYAVSIFFVIGGFLGTRALLRRADSPRDLHPYLELLRRWIRLSGQIYALMLAVVLVTVFDTTDTYAGNSTRSSVLHVLTYTYNWYAREDTLAALAAGEPAKSRPDFGHLWYVSVDMQVFVVVLLLVFLLRRHRRWLLVALATMLVSVLTWRHHVYVTEVLPSMSGDAKELRAELVLLRSTARMDAPVTGALAAAALPYLRRLRPYAPAMTVLGVVALVPLLDLNRPIDGYFGWPGIALDAVMAAIVVGSTLAAAPRLVSVPLGWAPLALLGRHSLALYLWHYPIFWFVARHTGDWDWWWRTLLALGLTAGAAVLSDRLVEQPVQRLMSSSVWRDLETDAAGVVRARLRQAAGR